MFHITADQVATLRSIHREAASAPDPQAFVTANLHRAFSEEQRSRIAEELDGFGASFEGFAEAIAADYLPDDFDVILTSIETTLQDAGLDVQLDV